MPRCPGLEAGRAALWTPRPSGRLRHRLMHGGAWRRAVRVGHCDRVAVRVGRHGARRACLDDRCVPVLARRGRHGHRHPRRAQHRWRRRWRRDRLHRHHVPQRVHDRERLGGVGQGRVRRGHGWVDGRQRDEGSVHGARTIKRAGRAAGGGRRGRVQGRGHADGSGSSSWSAVAYDKPSSGAPPRSAGPANSRPSPCRSPSRARPHPAPRRHPPRRPRRHRHQPRRLPRRLPRPRHPRPLPLRTPPPAPSPTKCPDRHAAVLARRLPPVTRCDGVGHTSRDSRPVSARRGPGAAPLRPRARVATWPDLVADTGSNCNRPTRAPRRRRSSRWCPGARWWLERRVQGTQATARSGPASGAALTVGRARDGRDVALPAAQLQDAALAAFGAIGFGAFTVPRARRGRARVCSSCWQSCSSWPAVPRSCRSPGAGSAGPGSGSRPVARIVRTP